MTDPGDLKLADRLARIETKLDQVLIDVAGLKVKASLWGGLLGAGFGTATAIIVALLGG